MVNFSHSIDVQRRSDPAADGEGRSEAKARRWASASSDLLDRITTVAPLRDAVHRRNAERAGLGIIKQACLDSSLGFIEGLKEAVSIRANRLGK